MTLRYGPLGALIPACILFGVSALAVACKDHSDRTDPPPRGADGPLAADGPFVGEWETVESRPSPESADVQADQAALDRALAFAKEHGFVFRVTSDGRASTSDRAGKMRQTYRWATTDDVARFELAPENGSPPEHLYRFTLSRGPDGLVVWTEGEGSAQKGARHTLQRKR